MIKDFTTARKATIWKDFARDGKGTLIIERQKNPA